MSLHRTIIQLRKLKASVSFFFKAYYTNTVMSNLNNALKKISIIEILIVTVILTGILFIFRLFNYEISSDWLYSGIIIYFVYRLRFFKKDFKNDIVNIFRKISLKSVITIVLVNVFFSYGMIYLSIYAQNFIPIIESYSLSSITANSIPKLGIISTVIVSPISEELLFRGVFLNRLKLVVPTTFAILITSILFGLLHDYSNIISAIIFGICMCIIYIKTQNIFTCILAHAINNLLAQIIFYLDTGNLIFTNNIFIVLISILAIVSFYLIIKSIRAEWKHIK